MLSFKSMVSPGDIRARHFVQRMIVLLLALSICYVSAAQTVYVTRTGKKYHDDDCRYLSKSKIETTLSDAKSKDYTACSVCKPPTTVTTNNELKPKAPPSTIRKVISTQCTGTTKAGKRCARMTKAANGKCYQH